MLSLDLLTGCEKAFVEQPADSASCPGCHHQPWVRPTLAHQTRKGQNGLMAAMIRMSARHPVLAFMVIRLTAGFVIPAIRPIALRDGGGQLIDYIRDPGGLWSEQDRHPPWISLTKRRRLAICSNAVRGYDASQPRTRNPPCAFVT
jgi:hypothetical protein